VELRIQVVAACLDGVHLHVLGKIQRSSAAVLDRAGEASCVAYTAAARVAQGRRGLWAQKSSVRPIADREHQVRVVNYIFSPTSAVTRLDRRL